MRLYCINNHKSYFTKLRSLLQLQFNLDWKIQQTNFKLLNKVLQKNTKEKKHWQ